MKYLSLRRQKFVDEYLVDSNGKRAALSAGYSKSSANNYNKILNHPVVKAEIERKLEERENTSEISPQTVINQLLKIAKANPGDAINFDQDALRENAAAVSSVKVKITPTANGETVEREIRFYDKIKALELLVKYTGMFGEQKADNEFLPVIISGDDEIED